MPACREAGIERSSDMLRQARDVTDESAVRTKHRGERADGSQVGAWRQVREERVRASVRASVLTRVPPFVRVCRGSQSCRRQFDNLQRIFTCARVAA
eukprot:1798825-Pleurochrysis_carterae.AAC.2